MLGGKVLKENKVLLSGDQSILWDAPLKLRLLHDWGYKVEHSIHTVDFFSQSNKQFERPAISLESYLPSGQLNRWTASLEASLFLGRMPIHPNSLAQKGVNLEKIALIQNKSLEETVKVLTESDWYGVSYPKKNVISHAIPVKELLAQIKDLKARLRKDLIEKLGHLGPTTDFLDQNFGFGLHKSQFWAESCLDLLRSTLNSQGVNGDIKLTTTTDEFSVQKNKSLTLLLLFLKHYSACSEAYNEAIEGPGENIRKLEYEDLPFYAVVKTGRGEIIRVNLKLESSFEKILVQAGRSGQVLAIVGKAVAHYVELRLQGPLVLPEKGSAYIPKANKFIKLLKLQQSFAHLEFNPVYRIHFSALDSLQEVSGHFLLPEYLQKDLGVTKISAKDFANVWRSLVNQVDQEISNLSGPVNVLLAQKLLARNLIDASSLSFISNLQEQIINSAQSLKSERGDNKRDPKRSSLQIIQQSLKTALCVLDSIRAKELSRLLATSQSLPYWNCRPFSHWVYAIPGWYEGILKHGYLQKEVD